MKLVVLLGILLPAVYSEQLGYAADGSDDISSFTFTWKDPDHDANAEGSGPTAAEGMDVTDGDLTTGYRLDNPAGGSWGSGGNPVGMTGDFPANLNVPTNMAYWNIDSASVTFNAECLSEIPTASAYYTDFSTLAKVILGDATVTADTNTGTVTFEAQIPAAGVNTASGPIGFAITSNTVCEGGFKVIEFVLTGTPVATVEPTESPTKKPSTAPTTATPTMAPTKSCRGEVTWGDPHFSLMAFDKNVQQLNYQGLGWFYYLFPCDMANYYNWPFFVLSNHNTCYWRGNPKGCINDNMLVLNTHPKPWIIEFTDDGFDITVGTDAAGQTSADFNTNKKYRKSNPLVIEYNDGGSPPQYGELHIYYDDGAIVLQLHDIGYDAYPRTCDRGEGYGVDCGDYKCEGLVIDVRNSGSWTAFSCPSCLRNIACGLMGKYERGDCTKSMLKDPSSKCYNVLVGSNGQIYTPPNTDSVFYDFAETWRKTTVDAAIVAQGDAVNFQQKRGYHAAANKMEGRALDVSDPNYYDGNCKGDMDKIREVNETCRLNTVVKYEKCCKEIGICGILWKGCIEDLCSCTTPNANNTMSDTQCLDIIIHESMNTTCSYELLYPTATPTGAPTPSPTGLVAGLPQGKKAKDLIWLYLIFVVLFVIIAGAAYWYYRKKNVGKISMEDDEEMEVTGHNPPRSGVETFTQD